MISFRNDYSEGAHPKILDALIQTNLESTPGYGEDAYCAAAAQTVRRRFACPDAGVHFLVGGTQTNTIASAAFLRPWEAMVAVDTGHVAVHETGAIEARGHKVITVPHQEGKMTCQALEQVWQAHTAGNLGHMVKPKLLYLSDSTELGTIYTRAELQALRALCDRLDMALYLDGARLGAALTAPGNDLVPEDLPQLCDAFTIGGTKNGLLFGECLVLRDPAIWPDFRFAMKQGGGMLAKGRLLGVQFQALLEQDLWLETARHANQMAARLTKGFLEAGYPLYAQSPTNQVFPILPKKMIAELAPAFSFEISAPVDQERDAVRFVTSWATRPEQVDALLCALRREGRA